VVDALRVQAVEDGLQVAAVAGLVVAAGQLLGALGLIGRCLCVDVGHRGRGSVVGLVL
jgi:hypothetical protein